METGWEAVLIIRLLADPKYGQPTNDKIVRHFQSVYEEQILQDSQLTPDQCNQALKTARVTGWHKTMIRIGSKPMTFLKVLAKRSENTWKRMGMKMSILLPPKPRTLPFDYWNNNTCSMMAVIVVAERPRQER